MTEKPLTLSVPEAGKLYLNMGRETAYAAARRGEIPTIRVGHRLRVPVYAMDRLLEQVSVKTGAA